MPSEKETKTNYKELHDLLSESYYNFHNISKEEFDIQHGEIWSNCEEELKTASDYIAPITPRNLEAEIDLMWEKLDEIHPESLWDKIKKIIRI